MRERAIKYLIYFVLKQKQSDGWTFENTIKISGKLSPLYIFFFSVSISLMQSAISDLSAADSSLE